MTVKVVATRSPKVKLRAVNHPKRGGNRFCGPAVISSLTGLDTGEAAALIRKLTGRRSVMGTHDHEVLDALRYSGLLIGRSYYIGGKQTLAAWHKDWRKSGNLSLGRVWLVSAGHHWQLVTARQYVCGRVREVVSIRDKRVKRRSRVKMVWEITKKEKQYV